MEETLRIIKKWLIIAVILFVTAVFGLVLSKASSPKLGLTKQSPNETSLLEEGQNYSKIRLNKGNAGFSKDADKEYIVIENTGENPIDISGWKLGNSDTEVPSKLQSLFKNSSANSLTIPYGSNSSLNIILGKNSKAIITIGKSPTKEEFFKESTCLKILEKEINYAFFPPISNSDQVYVGSFDECVNSSNSTEDKAGTWRVFLNEDLEFFEEKDEIVIFDLHGNVVKSIQY